MTPNLTRLFREYPATQWCFSWWHKVRYGSRKVEEIINEKCFVVEYFCKKCGKKTDGYTHFGTFEFSLNSQSK